MVSLYETRYTGWTVTHVHERWHTEHGGTRSYPWTKKTLQAAGHVARAPRRGAHRKKRPRRPLPGMRWHQDGSTHEWVPGCQWDLLVPLDEATTEIYSAFFIEEEGTLRSFRGVHRRSSRRRGPSVRSRRIGGPTTGTPTRRETTWTRADRRGPSGHRRCPVSWDLAGNRESGRYPRGVGMFASGNHARCLVPVTHRIHAPLPTKMPFLEPGLPTHRGEEPKK